MSTTAELQTKPASVPSFTPLRTNLLQRKCACGGTPGPSGECAECRKKRLQRRSTGRNGLATAPTVVHEALRAPGQPLDPATRAYMEPRFGHDFSRVRVHTDARAAESALAVNAIAYTFGQDIVFGSGQYRPYSRSGRYVLAHELTHFVQQSHEPLPSPSVSESIALGDTSDRFEQEADRVAVDVSAPHGESSSNLPVHLRAILDGGPGEVDRYKAALTNFQGEHDSDTLEHFQAHLGEPTNRVAVTQTSPLKQVRRLGRAPKGESREELETAPVTDEFVIDIFTFFYPDSPAPTQVNDSLRLLASEMLWEAIQASRQMDLVPRPTYSPPGISWLARQVVQAAWRRGRDRGIYVAVRDTVAVKHRSEYELAKEGVGF